MATRTANSILEATETWTYSCSISPVGTNDFTNTASVTGTPPVGPDVTDDDTAEVDVIHPAIHIVKTPASQDVQYGSTASFTLTVTNEGDVPLTDVVVTDPKCDALPQYQSGDTGNDGVLGLTEAWVYKCSTANVLADFVNQANVTGKPPVGPNVTDDDTANVHVLKGTIKLIKDFVQAPQGATVTIRITPDGKQPITGNVTDDGFIEGTFALGKFTVDEVSVGSDVDLDLYDQKVSCVNGQQSLASNPTGSSVSFDLTDGANVVCTITNSLRPKLTVTKVVVGDPGARFDLFVDQTKVIDDGGPNTSDTRTYSPATYTVSETMADGSTAVDKNVWDVVYSGDCDRGTGAVTLGYGDVKSCTITNSKRPVVNVVKEITTADDPGRFNLSLNGNAIPNGNPDIGYGDGGQTGFQVVPAGDVTVSEAGHGSTKLSSYYNNVECTWDGSDKKSGPAFDDEGVNYQWSFKAEYGDKVTCTFKNARKPSSIDVEKKPSSDVRSTSPVVR